MNSQNLIELRRPRVCSKLIPRKISSEGHFYFDGNSRNAKTN